MPHGKADLTVWQPAENHYAVARGTSALFRRTMWRHTNTGLRRPSRLTVTIPSRPQRSTLA